MEATEQIHSAQFLDHQLQEIISLLEKQRIETTLVQRGPSINHELIAAMLQNQHQSRLCKINIRVGFKKNLSYFILLIARLF